MKVSSSCLANSQTVYSNLLPFNNYNHHHFPNYHANRAKVSNLGLNLGFHSGPDHFPCRVHKPWDKGMVAARASWSSVAELEKELEAEMKREEMRFRQKCGEEGKGVVELLECLEKEAIMGEDVGKEPMDYNRRAQLFDRSSRVFQALKQLNSDIHVT